LARRDRACPICRRPAPPDAETGPFCSERCRTIDLGGWLDGRYAVAGEPVGRADEPSPDKSLDRSDN